MGPESPYRRAHTGDPHRKAHTGKLRPHAPQGAWRMLACESARAYLWMCAGRGAVLSPR